MTMTVQCEKGKCRHTTLQLNPMLDDRIHEYQMRLKPLFQQRLDVELDHVAHVAGTSWLSCKATSPKQMAASPTWDRADTQTLYRHWFFHTHPHLNFVLFFFTLFSWTHRFLRVFLAICAFAPRCGGHAGLWFSARRSGPLPQSASKKAVQNFSHKVVWFDSIRFDPIAKQFKTKTKSKAKKRKAKQRNAKQSKAKQSNTCSMAGSFVCQYLYYCSATVKHMEWKVWALYGRATSTAFALDLGSLAANRQYLLQ